jgi:hypothetical protein
MGVETALWGEDVALHQYKRCKRCLRHMNRKLVKGVWYATAQLWEIFPRARELMKCQRYM